MIKLKLLGESVAGDTLSLAAAGLVIFILPRLKHRIKGRILNLKDTGIRKEEGAK